ncbi:MAG: galactokinase [Opitutales bacterium]|nr:galactokinase [Opitutales bacterium]MCH8540549.1 galactokinase [Opitutales bacterium]
MSIYKEAYGQNPELTSSAPGRVEVIGNHVDYNGGLVIGAAIDRRVRLELGTNNAGLLRLVSGQDTKPVELPLGEGALVPLQGPDRWANYLLGVIKKLSEYGLPLDTGINLAVSSELPSGAGLSSSAALEMATAVAFNEWAHLGMDTKALVKAARWAENEFVGVPCGILDQGVVGFGRADSLVAIDCRKEEFQSVPLPADTCLWIFNSEKKHSLIDSFYADRHAECQKALSLLQRSLPEVSHLALVTAAQLEDLKESLPEPLARRARHVVEEQGRVQRFMEDLENGEGWETTGSLLTASHASSRDLFENSIDELDYLVEALAACPGVFGARLTGGGFGGAVLAVTSPSFAEPEGRAIAHSYQRRFGHSPQVIRLTPDQGARIDSI